MEFAWLINFSGGGQFVAISVVLIVAFSVLIALVSLIPEGFVNANLGTSLLCVTENNNYPSIQQGVWNWTLDNFTIRKMMNHIEVSNGDIIAAFSDYSRYWHGYMIVIKPLLVFLTLYQIQTLFLLVLMLLIVWNTCLLYKRAGWLVSLLFAACFVAISFPVVALSLPFSFSFAIALIFCGLIMSGCIKGQHMPMAFFIAGELTSFFDFLDNPVVSLGLPLATWIYFECNDKKPSECLKMVVFSCLAWGCGYCILWASKWVVTTLITGQDAISAALNQASYRSSTSLSGHEATAASSFTVWDTLGRNLNTMFPKWSLKALGGCALVCVVYLLAKRPAFDKTTLNAGQIIALVFVALLPVVWYLVLSNHSYVHYWFTYRNLIVLCWGVSLIVGLFASALRFDKGQ